MSPNEELYSQLTELHLHISEFLQNLESEKAEESDVIAPAEKTNTSIYGTPSEYNGTYNGTPRLVFITYLFPIGSTDRPMKTVKRRPFISPGTQKCHSRIKFTSAALICIGVARFRACQIRSKSVLL